MISALSSFFLHRWKYFLFVGLTMFVQYFLFPREYTAFSLKISNYYSLYFCFTVFFTFDFGFQRNIVRTGEKFILPYLVYTFLAYVFIFYQLHFDLYIIICFSTFSALSHTLSFYKYFLEYNERPVFSIFIRFYHTLVLFLSFYFASDLSTFFYFYFLSHIGFLIYIQIYHRFNFNFSEVTVTKSQFYFLSVNLIYLLGNVYDKYIIGERIFKNNSFIVVNESLTYTLSISNIILPLVVFNSSLTNSSKHNIFKYIFVFSIPIYFVVQIFLTYQFGFNDIEYNMYLFIFSMAILLNSSNSYLLTAPKETSFILNFVGTVLPTLVYFMFVVFLDMSFQLFLLCQIIKLLSEFILRNLFLKHNENKDRIAL